MATIQEIERPKSYSEGIWYLVRLREQWTLMAHRFSGQGHEIDHSQYWEKTVAPMLAAEWKLSNHQASELSLLVYGFPRGRVVNSRDGYIFFNGEDFSPFATKKQIANVFSLHSGFAFRFDDHERCQFEDKQALRVLLNLKEDWQAACG